LTIEWPPTIWIQTVLDDFTFKASKSHPSIDDGPDNGTSISEYDSRIENSSNYMVAERD
jgi:hypothetical protein